VFCLDLEELEALEAFRDSTNIEGMKFYWNIVLTTYTLDLYDNWKVSRNYWTIMTFFCV
jgi:hypothetical protein